MNKRRAQLYLAHSTKFEGRKAEAKDSASGKIVIGDDGLQPEDAASYIADLLAPLRDLAATAHLPSLSQLIEVAQREARLHCRQ